MAEVMNRVGRGAYDFALKTYNHCLLGSLNTEVKFAIQAVSTSAGVLTDTFKNDELQAANTAADAGTGGASGGRYTTVTPVPSAGNDIWKRGDVTGFYFYGDIGPVSLPNTGRGKTVGRNAVHCRRSLLTPSPSSRLLCWGQGQFVFVRLYGDNGSRYEPIYKSKTGYYEILEVLPGATQAQIKTAYYKKSFVYHPDRNAGSEEATVRFSQISEAYMVLGNKALRKKYDRGLLSQADLVATPRPSSRDGAGSSAKQQSESRRSVLGMEIRGSVYDFDKFLKAHYREQLQAERDMRARREEMQKRKEEKGERIMGNMMEMFILLLLVTSAGLIMSLKRG